MMPVLEQLDKSQHVIRLCEYALGVIQRAAVSASEQELLNFKSDPRLTSLLCGDNGALSADFGDRRKLLRHGIEL